MNFHHQPTKISGVNFPPGCPRDFSDQVRMMVRKHNQTVEDLLTYEQTVRELESINSDLRRQLNKNKTIHAELQAKYDTLKDVSEKLAVKYEKLIASSQSFRPIKENKIQVNAEPTPEIKKDEPEIKEEVDPESKSRSNNSDEDEEEIVEIESS